MSPLVQKFHISFFTVFDSGDNVNARLGCGNEMIYRIYSINRPGRLLNFWTLRVGAYYIFNIFSKCSMCILQQNNKW